VSNHIKCCQCEGSVKPESIICLLCEAKNLKEFVKLTRIEALEWAKLHARPYGGTGITQVIDTEIAYLKGEK